MVPTLHKVLLPKILYLQLTSLNTRGTRIKRWWYDFFIQYSFLFIISQVQKDFEHFIMLTYASQNTNWFNSFSCAPWIFARRLVPRTCCRAAQVVGSSWTWTAWLGRRTWRMLARTQPAIWGLWLWPLACTPWSFGLARGRSPCEQKMIVMLYSYCKIKKSCKLWYYTQAGQMQFNSLSHSLNVTH